jgi:hypothetical protein
MHKNNMQQEHAIVVNVQIILIALRVHIVTPNMASAFQLCVEKHTSYLIVTLLDSAAHLPQKVQTVWLMMDSAVNAHMNNKIAK